MFEHLLRYKQLTTQRQFCHCHSIPVFFCTYVIAITSKTLVNSAADNVAAVCLQISTQTPSCRQNPFRSNECPAAHMLSVSSTAYATHVRESSNRGFVSSLSPHISEKICVGTQCAYHDVRCYRIAGRFHSVTLDLVEHVRKKGIQKACFEFLCDNRPSMKDRHLETAAGYT